MTIHKQSVSVRGGDFVRVDEYHVFVSVAECRTLRYEAVVQAKCLAGQHTRGIPVPSGVTSLPYGIIFRFMSEEDHAVFNAKQEVAA